MTTRQHNVLIVAFVHGCTPSTTTGRMSRRDIIHRMASVAASEGDDFATVTLFAEDGTAVAQVRQADEDGCPPHIVPISNPNPSRVTASLYNDVCRPTVWDEFATTFAEYRNLY